MTQNEAIQNGSNPYVGPRPFERGEEDSKRFFGRSHETQEIVSLIFGHPVTLIYAQSGAGKTSLFNASISPKLEENGFEVLPLTRVGGVIPEDIAQNKINNIYIFNALLKLDPGIKPQEQLTKTLPKFLEMRDRPTDENGQLLPRAIIFDQFEEIFNYTPENWRDQRKEFFAQVDEAVNTDPLLRIVFVIREDFLAELDPYAHNLPESLRTRYRLERLGENAALHAIKDPLEKTPREFAPDVAENLVKELLATRAVNTSGRMVEIEGQYVEPVQLQVVCVTLWTSLKPDVTIIQQIHLQNFDVNSALSDFYESAIESASGETGVREANLRNWFGKTLITPMGTRSTAFRGEKSTGGIENDTVDFLESRHIIRAEFRAGVRWYELTHDRFIEAILENNKEWFSKNTSLLQRQAALWIQQGRSEGLLLRDQDLVNAEKEVASLDLSEDEKTFLEKCRELKKRNDREKSLRRALLVALVIAVIAFVVAGFSLNNTNQALGVAQRAEAAAQSSAQDALNQSQIAESQKLIAEEAKDKAEEEKKKADEQANKALSGNLAAQAESLKSSDHALALLLSVEAYLRGDNLLTRTTLFQLLQFSPYTRLFGFNGPVTSVAISPDGRLIAISSCREDLNGQCNNGNIKLYDAETNHLESEIPGTYGIVYSMVFNKDGTVLIAGGCVPSGGRYDGCADGKGQITFWGVENSAQPSLQYDTIVSYPEIHTNLVKTVALGPNDDILASGSYDKTIVLWDVTDKSNPKPIGDPLRDHSSFVNGLALHPKDKVLVSAGDDKIILIYDYSILDNPRLVRRISDGHTAPINDIAFNTDGSLFASGSDDNNVILWDWDSNSLSLKETEKLVGHSGYVKSIAFNYDGTLLASAGYDNKVLLWNIGEDKIQQNGLPLDVHSNAINSIAFGELQTSAGMVLPYLVSGSSDRTIIKWDLATRRALSTPVDVPAIEAKTRDSIGQLDALIDGEKIFLSNTNAPDIPDKKIDQHTSQVNSVAFSPPFLPDGTPLLASASDDQTVVLWMVPEDVVKSDKFLILNVFDSPVLNAYFAEDGKKLITVDKNGQFVEWTIEPSDWLARACNAIEDNLTLEQWERFLQYLPDQVRNETCITRPGG